MNTDTCTHMHYHIDSMPPKAAAKCPHITRAMTICTPSIEVLNSSVSV